MQIKVKAVSFLFLKSFKVIHTHDLTGCHFTNHMYHQNLILFSYQNKEQIKFRQYLILWAGSPHTGSWSIWLVQHSHWLTGWLWPWWPLSVHPLSCWRCCHLLLPLSWSPSLDSELIVKKLWKVSETHLIKIPNSLVKSYHDVNSKISIKYILHISSHYYHQFHQIDCLYIKKWVVSDVE